MAGKFYQVDNNHKPEIVIAAASITNGQWATLTTKDTTTGLERVTPVAANYTGSARKVGPCAKIIEYKEDIASQDTIASGDRCLWQPAANVEFEDFYLTSRVSGAFSSATPGADMVLTTSGYPTLDGADDDPGATATIVAMFKEVDGNSVRYESV